MTYNLTALNETDSFIDLTILLNNEISGGIAMGFLLALWVVLTVVFLKSDEDFLRTAFFSSFIVTFAAVVFWTIGMVAAWVIMIPLVLTIAAMIIIAFS